MTFIAAVASGHEATADLERLLATRIARGEVAWAAHRGHAVAWTARHRWVSSADDGDVLVVLDGQLHNLFESDVSQADLLRRRYREVGSAFGEGLLGDFVVIVLDRGHGRLLVCRDPLGVRPWYQAISGRRHAGATEVATLCALPWVDDSVDEPEALAYLAGDMRSLGPTLHRGIVTLAPGSTWTATASGQELRHHHRWDIRPAPEVTWDEAVERTRQSVEDAVRDRVRVTGSATSELSGGLDSSSIVGTLVHLGFDDLLTGRLLFDGPRADERTFSDAVIDHWRLRAVSAKPWLPTEDETAQWTADLRRPPPDPNFTMSAGLHRALLMEHRTSALTGLGGDDAFVVMSVPSLVVSAVQQRRWNLLFRLARTSVGRPRGSWQQVWRPTLGHLRPRRRARIPRHVSTRAAEALGLADRLAARPAALTGVMAVDERCDGLTSGYLARILEDGAVVADLTGWRTTHPYLDPRVIEATYGLDPWFPVRGGHYRAMQVAVFGDRLPPVVRDRHSKAEFSEVVCELSAERVRDITQGPLTRHGWLDVDGFSGLVHATGEGKAAAAFLLSRVNDLDRWLEAARS